jgi:hypothetical protein
MSERRDTKTGAKSFKARRGEAFGQNGSKLFIGWHMEYPELPQLNSLTNKVDVQLDVLRALVVHRVRRHIHGGDIVT